MHKTFIKKENLYTLAQTGRLVTENRTVFVMFKSDYFAALPHQKVKRNKLTILICVL